MHQIFSSNHDESETQIYRPQVFQCHHAEALQAAQSLMQQSGIRVLNTLFQQLKEWVKTQEPARRWQPNELEQATNEWLEQHGGDTYGNWVYYPWQNTLVRLLAAPEFIDLRTNRNRYKITRDEQAILSAKTVGIIGLSVGQAVAVTMAMERSVGRLKLADFDTLDLSNLNRLRAGVMDIGQAKTILVAREIAEIDPYLDVEVFPQGLTDETLPLFLDGPPALDLLIDECDGLDMKIQAREEARRRRIPVLMETSDRGMVDMERFDLEPNRPLLHGLIGDLTADRMRGLSNEDKVPYILKMIGSTDVSLQGKVSMVEVGQSISTWPQLASSVSLGGGIAADFARRLLLGKITASGRFYADPELLVPDAFTGKPVVTENPFQPLTIDQMEAEVGSAGAGHEFPDLATLETWVKAACTAPSTGNDQPWAWLVHHQRLHLFHERSRSYSFGDFQEMASMLSLGAAFESLVLKAHEMGWGVSIQLFPNGENSPLTASLSFHQLPSEGADEMKGFEHLSAFLYTRTTNRNPSVAEPLSSADKAGIQAAAESIPGARLTWIEAAQDMELIGRIIGNCDRIRVLNDEGHKDFVAREMRWTPEDAELTGTGIDIRTLGMTAGQLAALGIIRDWRVIEGLRRIGGGNAFFDVAVKTVKTASALGFIQMPRYSKADYFNGGRSLQRTWLHCEQLGWAVHPLISPFYLFPRILHGQGAGLNAQEILELKRLRETMQSVLPLNDHQGEVFLFKIARAAKPDILTKRLPLERLLFVAKGK